MLDGREVLHECTSPRGALHGSPGQHVEATHEATFCVHFRCKHVLLLLLHPHQVILLLSLS